MGLAGHKLTYDPRTTRAFMQLNAIWVSWGIHKAPRMRQPSYSVRHRRGVSTWYANCGGAEPRNSSWGFSNLYQGPPPGGF